MKHPFLFALISVFLITHSASVFAGNEKCEQEIESVLQSIGADPNAAPKVVSLRNLLKDEKLKKHGFKLSDDGTALFDVSNPSAPVVVGKLQRANVPYVYEWAETPTHEAWLRRNGINRSEMDSDIEAPGQAAGKGYYVSSDPIDSISYGHAVTIFRPGRSMVILSDAEAGAPFLNGNFSERAPVFVDGALVNSSEFDTVTNDTNFVKRARAAGIDGFRVGGSKTWISVVNNDLLRDASGVNKEFIENYIKKSTKLELFGTILNFETKPYESAALKKVFPKTHPFYKWVMQSSLTPKEVLAIGDLILKSPSVPGFNANQPFFHYLQEKVLSPYLELKLAGRDGLGLVPAIQLLSQNAMDYKTAADLIDRLHPKMNSLQKNYRDMTGYFNLTDIVAANGGADLGIKPYALPGMKAQAKSFAEAGKRLQKIPNPQYEDFMAEIRQFLGKKPEFRSESQAFEQLNTNHGTHDILSQNHLLSVEAIDPPVPPVPAGQFAPPSKMDPNLPVHFSVDYPSIKNYQSFNTVLSPKLLKRLNNVGPNPDAKLIAELNQNISEELARGLLDPTKQIDIVGSMMGYTGQTIAQYRNFIQPTSFEIYSAFMSIHPLTEGNEAMAKLLFSHYEVPVNKVYVYGLPTMAVVKDGETVLQRVHTTQAQRAQKEKQFQKMSRVSADQRQGRYQIASLLPNLELFANNDLQQFSKLQPAINYWLSMAGSDEEFLGDAQAIYNSLIKSNASLKTIYPDLLGTAAPVAPVAAPAAAARK